MPEPARSSRIAVPDPPAAVRAPAPFIAGPSSETADPRRWLALPVVLTATFLGVLDFFIVNVSVPSIQHGLHADAAEIQLVIALYALAYATFLITGGRIGDILGRKRVFMLGVGGFTLASALCGLAPDAAVLIAARVVQGAMAALMVPQVLSIMQVTFPVEERAMAFGVYGTVIGLGSIAGQILGGLLLQADLFGLGWRPVFLVNLPVGLAALIAAGPLLRESRVGAGRLDLLGVAIVSPGLFLLVFPLVEGREAGWPPWAFISLAAAVPVLALFAWHERRLSGGRGAPLIDMSLFRERAFAVGLIVVLAFFSGLPAFFFTLTLLLQSGLGYSALHAGLSFAPFAAGFFCASLLSVKLVTRLGTRILNLGSALMGVALVGVMITVRRIGPEVSGFQLAPALLLYGVGQGTFMPPLFNAILRGVRSSAAGSASGVISTMQQLAGAIGVSAIGIVFFVLLGSSPTPARYSAAFSTTLYANIALIAVTFLLVLLLPASAGVSLAAELPVIGLE